MKNIIKLTGLITLIIFSFFYTDKVIEVIREEDSIMIELKGLEESYKVNPVNASIVSNTIIPGINGKNINLDKMNEASKLFLGTHDFRSFCSNEEAIDYSFVREISEIKIEKSKENLVVFVTGNGFMRYMVRNIVGTLLEIALEKKDESIITSRLDKTIKDVTPYCAPGCGLYLYKVNY